MGSKQVVSVAALLGAGLMLGQAAEAGLLNLGFENPDISASFVSVNYNSAADQFTATSAALEIHLASGDYAVQSDSYSLSVGIDGNGDLVMSGASAGTLAISGKSTALGIDTVSNLLSGNVIDFGWATSGSGAAASSTLEFEVEVNAANELGISGRAVVLMSGLTVDLAGGGWANDFSENYGTGNANIVADNAQASVPVPAPLALLALGLGVLGGVRRRA